MSHYTKLPMLLMFIGMPMLTACLTYDLGEDELGEAEAEAGTETETEAGTGTETEAGTETDADAGVDGETETEGTATETAGETGTDTIDETAENGTETGEVCEISYEVGDGEQDCFIMIVCPELPDHSLNCSADGCRCFEGDAQVGNCADSLAVCSSPDDLAVLDDCCGW
jgi:hypothetical protein